MTRNPDAEKEGILIEIMAGGHTQEDANTMDLMRHIPGATVSTIKEAETTAENRRMINKDEDAAEAVDLDAATEETPKAEATMEATETTTIMNR